DFHVTGVQTCALPISAVGGIPFAWPTSPFRRLRLRRHAAYQRTHFEQERVDALAERGQIHLLEGVRIPPGQLFDLAARPFQCGTERFPFQSCTGRLSLQGGIERLQRRQLPGPSRRLGGLEPLARLGEVVQQLVQRVHHLERGEDPLGRLRRGPPVPPAE